MTKDPLCYDKWIGDALLGVIRRSLASVAAAGLPGEHHFYITFRTDAEGVEMAHYLRAQHPEEMTIVLQHQFSDLDVDTDRFAVSLTFNGQNERLRVPFAAVTAFVDPSVNFGLQLRMLQVPSVLEQAAPGVKRIDAQAKEAMTGHNTDSPADEGRTGEIITLDSFRKK